MPRAKRFAAWRSADPSTERPAMRKLRHLFLALSLGLAAGAALAAD